jgi:undecaprenyl-diphosphatase
MKKRNLIISILLLICSIIFIILLKNVDIKCNAVNNSCIGFSTINQYLFNKIGVNMLWYTITDWLGIIPILMSFVYAIIGIKQLIKRKSIKRVDNEMIVLGIFYMMVISIYILFEKYIINYRPILMNGLLEASFPSSHTLMTICLCGSSIIINNRLFKNKFTKIVNVISLFITIITIIGRLISGVHWFTDIIGGILISSFFINVILFNFKFK